VARLPIFFLALLLGLRAVRAEDASPTPTPPSEPTVAPVTSRSPAPEKPDETNDDDEQKPYTEGWHGGSPPGERFTARAELWALSMQKTLLEVGHLQHTRAVTTDALGEPTTGTTGGLGIEGCLGKSGWLAVDWWSLQSRGLTTLGESETLDETNFPEGTVVSSQVIQHFVVFRDGLDIRYRIPEGDETWIDLNFGPVSALAVRYESFSVRAYNGPASSDALLAVTLTPGWRGGVDLHALDGFIIRIGTEGEILPHLPYNWLSFTREPSVSSWADASAYLAVRFEFVEVSFGWRYFRTLASGGHFRQADSEMKGIFGEVAARF
jgi:hypothetical protein